MTPRPGAIAVARVVNGLFFLALSAYCFLAYTPFAYDAFIKPGVSHALWFFIVIASALFWVALLIATLTLMPQLRTRGARGRLAAWCYVGVGAAAGLAVVKWPLTDIGNTPTAFWLGMAALVWPVWIAVIDHRIWPAPPVGRTDPFRALAACVISAAIACVTYAAMTPVRLARVFGIDAPPRILLTGAGASLVFDLYVFIAWYLTILTVAGFATLAGAGASVEYWSLFVPFVAIAAVVINVIVCLSLGFLGPASVASSIALAIGIAAIWADLARLRSQATMSTGVSAVTRRPIDAVALLCAPVAGCRSRKTAIALVVVLPVAANICIGIFQELDWNFLMQKLSVLTFWSFTFAGVYAALPAWPSRRSSVAALAAAPVAVFVAFQLLTRVNPELAIDRYATLDASLRLIRDARTAQSSETAKEYAYLRSQTLIVMPESVRTPAVDFVRPLQRTPDVRPDIYLLIIDSLRRDYLSPYNSQVTFTPAIGKLAADSFVFDRAWTRYSGTLLSVPSIWAGGLVPHTRRQPQIRDRNTLLKLIEANDYRQLMDLDSVVETFDLRRDRLVELNPGHEGYAATDLCTTMATTKRLLPRDRTQPTFFYSLPQNIHPAVVLKNAAPVNETYPAGFEPRVASSLHRIDACIGDFLDLLKREHRYDDSIIIVTSDHGDLLGEEGRWGHSFWVYPDVMRVPLIVHVPERLRAAFRVDLDAQVFLTDIAPSLYVLLGYQPRDLGPLFGRSFFGPRDGDSSWRRREASLIASSYGAVYGLVSQNGRRVYVVDTVDATEYALDLTRAPRRLAVTPLMMFFNRRLIADRLSAIAAFYHYPS